MSYRLNLEQKSEYGTALKLFSQSQPQDRLPLKELKKNIIKIESIMKKMPGDSDSDTSSHYLGLGSLSNQLKKAHAQRSGDEKQLRICNEWLAYYAQLMQLID